MYVNRFECVVGAGRIQPARVPEERRAKRHLITGGSGDEQELP